MPELALRLADWLFHRLCWSWMWHGRRESKRVIDWYLVHIAARRYYWGEVRRGMAA